MLGSRYKTKYADADMIYPALFAALAELGTSPAMEDARLRMRMAAEEIGRGWHSEPHLVSGSGVPAHSLTFRQGHEIRTGVLPDPTPHESDQPIMRG